MRKTDFTTDWCNFTFYDPQIAWWLPSETLFSPWWSSAWFSSEVTLPCLQHHRLQGWILWELWSHMGLKRWSLSFPQKTTIILRMTSWQLYPTDACLHMEGSLNDATITPVWRVRSLVKSYQCPPAACVRGSLYIMSLQRLQAWNQCPGMGHRL